MLKIVSDWAVSAAALLAALGAIYRYAIRPFTRTIREMQAGIHWVQARERDERAASEARLLARIAQLEMVIQELRKY